MVKKKGEKVNLDTEELAPLDLFWDHQSEERIAIRILSPSFIPLIDMINKYREEKGLGPCKNSNSVKNPKE